MGSVFNFIERLGPAGFVLEALAATAAAIGLLLVFILVRRAARQRLHHLRDQRTLALRRQWPQILDGTIAPESWRFNPLDRDVVESILLDRLEVAPHAEAAILLGCLRATGLLDMRIYEARTLRGWKRRQALVSLGRMHAPEAIPALAEALDDSNLETRIAAVRGLGRTGLAAAAEPILERVFYDTLRVPSRPLQNALLSCCREHPSVLLPYVRKADDRARPLLARVLGEIATPELDDDLLLLASDPLPEVRAAAARALAEAKPRLALTALASLAEDPVWFVRLRAVIALGALHDPRTIPVLMESLCDPNRYVRLRSAAALARLEGHIGEILSLTTQTGDRYALQALVSELQRSGGILELARALLDKSRKPAAEQALLGALRAGAQRMLLDALVRHSNGRVRVAVARLLARSGEAKLLPHVERIAASAATRRERQIACWLAGRLRAAAGPEALLEKVPA